MITLTTDFGLQDPYVGVMKGILHSLAPTARIVDLCHGVHPQDVVAGAQMLEESVPYFPPGTIHVAVIDPGVGTNRRALAIRTNRSIFVGPDNGIFELALTDETFEEAVTLSNADYFIGSLPHLAQGAALSSTFHGRDIFAPVAAHLHEGVAFSRLGETLPREAIVTLPIAEPCITDGHLKVHILRVDHFGNLITNVRREFYTRWNPKNAPVTFRFQHASFSGICATYGDVAAGSPVAYFGSSNRLEIAISGGNAARFFQVDHGFSLLIEKS